MKLYVVRGYENFNVPPIPGEESPEFINFYGVFSTEEKACEIRDTLKVHNPDKDEEFEVEEIELNKPTELYYFMTND